jgi:intracellular sulfur oxidation DsrE/DsrF family protein
VTWIPNRRALVAGLGATLAALTAGAKPLRAQSTAQKSGPARHDLDRWMDELPTGHRIFVDTASRQGGQDGVQFSGNLFNINESPYGVKPSDVAVIICFRHQSTAYGYNDAMWAKYGQYFSQRLELPKPVTVNPVNPAGPLEEGARTVATLADKGAVFAVCSQATRGMAGRIAMATGQSQEAVLKELMANPVRNGRFVPAGVVAATHAQEYGYTLLSCA